MELKGFGLRAGTIKGLIVTERSVIASLHSPKVGIPWDVGRGGQGCTALGGGFGNSSTVGICNTPNIVTAVIDRFDDIFDRLQREQRFDCRSAVQKKEEEKRNRLSTRFSRLLTSKKRDYEKYVAHDRVEEVQYRNCYSIARRVVSVQYQRLKFIE